MRRALWMLVLAGCGAATSAPTESPDCEPARARAEGAWGHLADLGGGQDEGPTTATPIDAALARLAAHLEALRESPTEVEGEVAMEVSSAVMDALDELGPDVPTAEREQCDNAAEALLTDRSARGSATATRAAIAALQRALAATHPEEAAGRDARVAVAALARRARSAADGYGEDVRVGDRRADRAEAALVPDDAPEPITSARTEAIEASRAAREACGFARTLSVPSL